MLEPKYVTLGRLVESFSHSFGRIVEISWSRMRFGVKFSYSDTIHQYSVEDLQGLKVYDDSETHYVNQEKLHG